ncbi:MAG: hypothetical protein EOP35_21045 [Rubrivivax sp.]|nr:MAG: hypothetical protein EOP35_21045 [Rubrivivax sp.]
MWSWLALLVTPLVSLGNLGLAHALVTPSCAHQTELGLHALHAASVALCLLLLVMAWREHGLPTGRRDDGSATPVRQRFIGALALPSAALFTLVTGAQWASVWVMSPCAG